ncbi:hypothetical protein NHF50_05510 [Flavobacterium sp. NRK F10]|uniref:Uncharacterized protein n=1 Tax=Flavobacterium sediminis TaxID=2201181 RepID=A0A2U8QT44_9FLAO|nr:MULTISPECIES: hypothetical protein [Flavobacterium]AWM13308.1 hypothetical protein DI487_05155 [Flavobacterium sediminis]MCO6174494.1 hypothetical protein [Flavobacterium sp. NRK F10]
MTFYKIFYFIYLVFAGFFIYDAYMKIQEDKSPWLSIIIALVAIGMFLFRRHFYNKYQNRDK